MSSQRPVGYVLRSAVCAGVMAALAAPALAQDTDGDVLDVVIVTGTRIQNQNVIAASPVTTIGQEEISLKQTPNIERVFRDLPITIPGDGENVNNGTAGQATLDLRGLGPERSLIMIDGKRLAPYDIDGQVTTDVIPVNMLERVDVVTGGASAVYGSDALSGAVNFIMRKNFEGVEIDMGYSDTEEGGDDTYYINALFGVNFDDDRGNITIGGGRTSRGAILLAERDFGLFGVSSATGSGLGSQPARPSADCSGNTEFTTAHSTGVGSTTAIPATLNLRSGNSFQFRDDGSLVQGECARFNFNPFNYYQTPQERWQATTVASYDITDDIEMYARASFANNRSDFQIAPSGTFGTAFTIPVGNPFFTDATRHDDRRRSQRWRGAVPDRYQCGDHAYAGTRDRRRRTTSTRWPRCRHALVADPLGFNAVGIQDLNGDGVFDATDAFTSTARRRTLELGPRTGIFDTDYSQFVWGVRGNIPRTENWNFDVSYQRGESDFVETRDGFTNLTNLQAGINTVDANQCIDALGNVTAAPCTPINIFGPVGSITDAQRDAGFFIAIASDLRRAEQTVYHASVDGTIDQVSLPWADDGISVAFGFENRQESANSAPDECLEARTGELSGRRRR